MKRTNKFSGLTGVALAGFFGRLSDQVVQKKVVDVELKPNGRISPEWLIGWAKTRGYSAEKLQNGKIRVGVVVTP
jgi:hypothetical protein